MAESSWLGLADAGPTATNRCPGVDSLRKLGELDAQVGVVPEVEDDQLRDGAGGRERSSFSPKAENGAAISIAGAVHASCERNTSLTISRNAPIGRDQRRADGPLGHRYLVIASLDQLELLDQRAAGRAAVTTGAEPRKIA